jgi:hypothetical protein
MNESADGTRKVAQGMSEPKLPRRDRILLPAIALVTIVVLCGSTETVARHAFRAWNSTPSCYTMLSETEPEATPNCVYVKKIAESAPVTYSLNSCGHRTSIDCTRKAPDTYRIVVIGSSVVLGAHVAEPDTFVHLLSTEIPIGPGGKRVEFYDASLGGGSSPRWYAERFDEILAVKPDMILWPIVPHDVRSEEEPAPPPRAYRGPLGVTRYRLMQAWKARSISQAMSPLIELVRTNLDQTSTAAMLEHYLYLSPSEYQKVVSADPGEDGFLRTPFDAIWQEHIRIFAGDAAVIEDKAESAGVPVVAFMLPDLGQANMLSMGDWPHGWDPYALDNELRRIVTSNGGTYFDILQDYRTIPQVSKDFYPVSNHPNERGHKLLAAFIAAELVNTPPLALSDPNSSGTISQERK